METVDLEMKPVERGTTKTTDREGLDIATGGSVIEETSFIKNKELVDGFKKRLNEHGYSMNISNYSDFTSLHDGKKITDFTYRKAGAKKTETLD